MPPNQLNFSRPPDRPSPARRWEVSAPPAPTAAHTFRPAPPRCPPEKRLPRTLTFAAGSPTKGPAAPPTCFRTPPLSPSRLAPPLSPPRRTTPALGKGNAPPRQPWGGQRPTDYFLSLPASTRPSWEVSAPPAPTAAPVSRHHLCRRAATRTAALKRLPSEWRAAHQYLNDTGQRTIA